jgi:hypothetical protein
VAAVDALPTCPPAWAPALQRARKRLAEVDAAGAQLEQLVDRHVASLLSLAAKWLEKEPDVAHRALSAVLRLRPANAKGRDLLEKLGRKAQEARIALFDGKSGNGWSYLDMPVWSVEGGAIVGTADKDGFICQTEKHFEGDFDVVVEMRILEERGRGSMAEMGGAMKDLYRRSTLGIHDGRLVWTESETANDFREVFSATVGELAHPFDPKAWNVYELRFRGSLLHAVVNGEVVSTQPRPEGRDKGMVGLRVRNVKAAFRRVDIVPR